ncbi:MAG: peptide-methionine (S)-S-oxide reductase MsrA [Terriglobales bacterium]
MRTLTAKIAGLVVVAGIIAAVWVGWGAPGARAAAPLAPPTVDDALAPHAGRASIVLAGGCFWGVQLVFEHVRGVISATDGYAGGDASTAQYDTVSTGRTGHAESVRVVYDPAQVTLGKLLQVFFSVATDPTEWNRQGPDEGTQYRSVIFYSTPRQLEIGRDYIRQLQAAHAFGRPIVTELTALSAARGFYPAEAYHQDYARLHPYDTYIRLYDLPKLTALRAQWPQLAR